MPEMQEANPQQRAGVVRMKVDLSKDNIEIIISWAQVRDVEWDLDKDESVLLVFFEACLESIEQELLG